MGTKKRLFDALKSEHPPRLTKKKQSTKGQIGPFWRPSVAIFLKFLWFVRTLFCERERSLAQCSRGTHTRKKKRKKKSALFSRDTHIFTIFITRARSSREREREREDILKKNEARRRGSVVGPSVLSKKIKKREREAFCV